MGLEGYFGVGVKLGTLAKLYGLTQSEIAKACKISRVSINRFFTGKTEIKTHDLVQILRLFDIDIEAEIDACIQRKMNSPNPEKDPSQNEVYKDVATLMEQIGAQERKTLLEQVIWWSRYQCIQRPPRLIMSAIERIEKYLSKSTTNLRSRV